MATDLVKVSIYLQYTSKTYENLVMIILLASLWGHFLIYRYKYWYFEEEIEKSHSMIMLERQKTEDANGIFPE